MAQFIQVRSTKNDSSIGKWVKKHFVVQFQSLLLACGELFAKLWKYFTISLIVGLSSGLKLAHWSIISLIPLCIFLSWNDSLGCSPVILLMLYRNFPMLSYSPFLGPVNLYSSLFSGLLKSQNGFLKSYLNLTNIRFTLSSSQSIMSYPIRRHLLARHIVFGFHHLLRDPYRGSTFLEPYSDLFRS